MKTEAENSGTPMAAQEKFLWMTEIISGGTTRGIAYFIVRGRPEVHAVGVRVWERNPG